MIQKISVFAFIGLLSFSQLNASSDGGEDKQAPFVNRTLDAYLETTEKPKLILGCGHNGDLDKEEFKVSREMQIPTFVPNVPFPVGSEMRTVTSNLFKKDIHDSLHYHTHDGWFAVDKDSRLNADVCGDLSLDSTLDCVLKPNSFELVYLEWLDLEATSSKLLQKILPSLKDGGSLILTLPLMLNPQNNKLELTKSVFAGPFNKQPDTLGPLWLEFKERYNRTSFEKVKDFEFLLSYFFRAMNFKEVICHVGNFNECMGYEVALKHGMQSIPVGIGNGFEMHPHMSTIRPVGNKAASELDLIFRSSNLGFYYLIAKK